MKHQKHPLQPKKIASINIPLKNILNYIFKIFIYLYIKKNKIITLKINIIYLTYNTLIKINNLALDNIYKLILINIKLHFFIGRWNKKCLIIFYTLKYF